MPIAQKKSKFIVKGSEGLVHVLPETAIEAVDGLSAELASSVHKTGAETIDGVKTFSKNTVTSAIAISGSEINASLGSFFTKTVTTDTAFTFTGVPSGTACVFTLVLTNGGAHAVAFPQNVTWTGGAAPQLNAAGVDCLTFFTIDGGTTWMEVSGSGAAGSGGGSIADSGVVAGSYGPSSNEFPAYGGTFTVPQFTVNQKGQVTGAFNKTITIPASDNTDVKVAVVENSWAKSYLLGVDAAANQISGSPLSVTATADKAVYLGGNPGTLYATTFNGALEGTATKATGDADGNPIKTTYAKLASPALTGTPTAPTASAGTSTTQIATTAFVADAVAGASRGTAGAVASTEISLASGSVFTKTISADTAFTIADVPAGAAMFSLVLEGGGSYTVSWPSSVKWKEGTVPSLSASGADLLMFLTVNGGTSWYGVHLADGLA